MNTPLDFLKWMFGSFWRFIGVLILLSVVLGGIADMIHGTRNEDVQITKEAS